MKRGDLVNIWTQRGIVQEEIKSIGSKYITTKRYKFDRDTLKEVNGCGYVSYIIEDLEEYYKGQKKKEIIILIKKFDYRKLTLDDAIKIQEILEKYK